VASKLARKNARRAAAAIEARRQAASISVQRMVRGFVGWCRARDRRVAKAADVLRSSVARLLGLGVGGPMIVALSALASTDSTSAKDSTAASPKSKHFQALKQAKAVSLPATSKSGASSAALMATCTGAHETAMHFSV
jgi:hypothetical protein